MKISSFFIIGILCFIFQSCNLNTLVDSNDSIENNSWSYHKKFKVNYQIKDTSAVYTLNFKLRINDDYRYANLFVLTKFNSPKDSKTLRYQFQLANKNGDWLGKGSANIYSFILPLKNNIKYSDTGTYSIEIEQNMRDNPLIGVSDIGIEVVKL